MRKVSTVQGLVGLTLVAAVATAHAQAAAPAAIAAAAAVSAAPPAGTAVAAPVPAPDPAPVPAPPTASQRRIQLGLTFLPMGAGRFTAAPGGMTFTADAAFAFGFGLSAGYMVLPGLIVGIAPQVIFNVKTKEDGGEASEQYDLMARVAYSFPIADTIAIYAEALPGYSRIVPPFGDRANGLVLGFGGGATMDLTGHVYANLGVGYQMGFQKRSANGIEADVNTKYVRVALGGGVRF